MKSERDGETERLRDRETERQRNREIEKQRKRETDRQTYRQTDRQRDNNIGFVCQFNKCKISTVLTIHVTQERKSEEKLLIF